MAALWTLSNLRRDLGNLFIICFEFLSRLLNSAEVNDDVKGIHVTRNSLVVSHLLFANDLLLLSVAKKKSILGLQACV